MVRLLFEYLAMLRAQGPQEWVYQELADVGAMKARYVEEEDATDYVTAVTANMLYVQPEHVLLSDYLYRDWDPDLVGSRCFGCSNQAARPYLFFIKKQGALPLKHFRVKSYLIYAVCLILPFLP